MFPTLTIGITDQNCCWWLACFSFIRMPPVRTSTRQAARHNHAPAARGSARGHPASRSGPRTSTTLRAADGAPDLAAQEPGTSSGSSRTSVATSSPPGPTIQTLNLMMIQRLDALEGRMCTTRSARGCQCCRALQVHWPQTLQYQWIYMFLTKYIRRFCRMNLSTLPSSCSGRRETWSTSWQSTASLGSQTWCWHHSQRRPNCHSRDGWKHETSSYVCM